LGDFHAGVAPPGTMVGVVSLVVRRSTASVTIRRLRVRVRGKFFARFSSTGLPFAAKDIRWTAQARLHGSLWCSIRYPRAAPSFGRSGLVSCLLEDSGGLIRAATRISSVASFSLTDDRGRARILLLYRASAKILSLRSSPSRSSTNQASSLGGSTSNHRSRICLALLRPVSISSETAPTYLMGPYSRGDICVPYLPRTIHIGWLFRIFASFSARRCSKSWAMF
jgi:hypothetical protein